MTMMLGVWDGSTRLLSSALFDLARSWCVWLLLLLRPDGMQLLSELATLRQPPVCMLFVRTPLRRKCSIEVHAAVKNALLTSLCACCLSIPC